MAQQTAVEWLINNLPEDYILALPYELVEQAKEKDKQQKKYFFDCGRQYQLTGEGTFTQVYDETYGK
jgi:hypothetical protein